MQPFEWVQAKIPFLYSDEEHPNYDLLEMVNAICSFVIGIHKSSLANIEEMMIEDYNCNTRSKMEDIIVLDLSYTYEDPLSRPPPSSSYTIVNEDQHFELGS